MTDKLAAAIKTLREARTKAPVGKWSMKNTGAIRSDTYVPCGIPNLDAQLKDMEPWVGFTGGNIATGEFIALAANIWPELMDVIDAAQYREANGGHSQYCDNIVTKGQERCSCGDTDLGVSLEALAAKIGEGEV